MNISKKEFNKAQKKFSKESLSVDEMNSMLSGIYGEQVSPIIVPTLSPIQNIHLRQKVLVLAFSLVLVLSGATYTAAKSLPGDVLYKVKTQVIEPVQMLSRTTPESKKEYQVNLLDKRIKEIDYLKKNSKYNTDTEAEVYVTVKKNIEYLEKNFSPDKDDNLRKTVVVKIEEYNSNVVDVKLKLDSQIFKDVKSGDLEEGDLLQVKVLDDDFIVPVSGTIKQTTNDILDVVKDHLEEEDVEDIEKIDVDVEIKEDEKEDEKEDNNQKTKEDSEDDTDDNVVEQKVKDTVSETVKTVDSVLPKLGL